MSWAGGKGHHLTLRLRTLVLILLLNFCSLAIVFACKCICKAKLNMKNEVLLNNTPCFLTLRGPDQSLLLFKFKN